jgi:hypothetical protein
MISGFDRHASDWLSRLRVPGARGLDLDHAYKAMARLGEVDAAGRSTAEAVEEALYRHRQPLFGAVSIAFLDTTTLWFEGAGGESLGQYGHSKDYRGHLKQVVLGIMLDDADPTSRGEARSEFRVRKRTSNYMILVWFWT